MFTVSLMIFVLSITGLFLVFVFNPLLIWVLLKVRGRRPVKTASIQPSVSLIIVVRNAEELIADKVRNSISLDYPSDEYEIIIFSDGSTDKTEEIVKPFVGDKVRLLSSEAHEGKNSGINKAVESSCGEILVFSDGDARLEKEAVMHLVKYFADSEVGGVCGRQMLYKSRRDIDKSQKIYKDLDSKIKALENQIGSISSNDGTLYAIRKRLFRPIPLTVTDDLYICLLIIKRHYRFVFESKAVSYIKGSSRDVGHEIRRRRRIISTSLNGIFMMRELLNPFRYGSYSVRIFINKVLRRLIPINMILLFLSSIYLASSGFFIKLFLFLQIFFYMLAGLHGMVVRYIPNIRIITSISSHAFYFCVGNYGMLLGVLDFIRGRQLTKWEPKT